MKKTLLLIGIIVWVMVLVLVVAALAGGWFRGGLVMDSNAEPLKDENISMAGIESISVETDSMNVELYATTGEQMHVTQYGGASTKPAELYTVDIRGGKVQLRVKHLVRFFSFDLGMINERLVVEIPQAWLGGINVANSSGRVLVADAFTWRDVSLSTSSGNVVLDRELNADNLSMRASSGTIRVLGALTVADKFRAESSSGNIRAEAGLTAKDIYAKANSGAIHLGETTTERFELRCSSGSITVDSISGGGNAQVNSGGIDINLAEPLADVDLQASSGNIRVNVDQAASFNFEGSCSSGSIRAGFPLDKNDKGSRASAVVGANPTFTIKAQTNSGSINVNQ